MTDMNLKINFHEQEYAPFDLTLQIANGKDGAWQDYAAIRDQNDANFARDVLVIGNRVNAYDFIPSHMWRVVGEK